VTDRFLLEQAMCQFCANVAEKLRRQHSVCRQMIVFAHTSRFHEQQFIIHSTVTFQTPTSNTQEMTETLLRIVRSQWRPNTPYKRAGVIVLAVSPESGVQQSLFDSRDRQRDQRLQQAIDRINNRHGKSTIGFTPNIPTEQAAELYDVGAKSPAYTTRLQDIITLKC
jgi:DNA polymerase V